MIITRVGIIQQVHGTSFLITTNVAHRIIKARKSNHILLLRHDLPFAPHSRIILGRVLKKFPNDMRDDIPKALPPFLYLLISTNYLHPDRCGEILIQFKIPSSSSKGTTR